jgi:SpoVK/Ycf46/Vps4 family AAA+-type ATPase
MVFTGNPGCAKTTVARLLCDILRKEEVLKTGNFVECGRADLVGRYVGWTAKAVKARFREAKGGILFIDEAYSLVDDSNSFGAEAINTIVQEMENARDEVIVIFAGYPEPMERFIEQNEGMRSRIAFHLKFPDYNPDELMGIMDLMLKKKELEMDLPARSECKRIFELACDVPDFGNGRFVRNLLEQAIMKQAGRLLPPGIKKRPSKSEITLLKKEDFQVNISQMLKNETKLEIGFASNF